MSTRRKATRLVERGPSPPLRRPSRSPARNRNVSPARKNQPARQAAAKSPARRSPGRPPKYPARKSPARTVKATSTTDPELELTLVVPKSPGKRPALKTELAVKLEDIPLSQLESVYRGTRSKRRESIALESSETEIKENGLSEVRRRISISKSLEDTPRRLSKLRETVADIRGFRRSASKTSHSESVSKSKSKSIAAYSDEENSDENYATKARTDVTRKLSTPLRNSYSDMMLVAKQWEFGGRIGTAALIILIPLSVLTILTSCMKSCSINTILNFSPFKSTAIWFSVPASLFVAANILIQGVFATIPYFGFRTDGMDDTGKKHCFNALSSSVFTISLLYGLHHFEIISKQVILQEYLKLATASYIFAVILSIALFVKSRKLDREELNPYGNTGFFLYDFCVGREKHPCFRNLDFKLWISRISNISTLTLSVLMFTQQLEWTCPTIKDLKLTNLRDLLDNVPKISNNTACIFSFMQILYILNFITKEYRVTSTFYWQSEGVGYLQAVSCSLYPFLFTTLSKYVADTDLTLSTNYLVLALLLYALGYYIMLKSNNIKYGFRRNPLQHSLANVESMVTFHGKRLIISGLWGSVRHPNYTGDILIHLALAIPGLVSGEIIAASPALITILVLIHRAWRDDARCEKRYGSAWNRYCKKVPYVFIPKVF